MLWSGICIADQELHVTQDEAQKLEFVNRHHEII